MQVPRIKKASNAPLSSGIDAACDANAAEAQAGAQGMASDNADADHELFITTLRVWGTTLFVLALPVLALATFRGDPVARAQPLDTAEICEPHRAVETAREKATDCIRLPVNLGD